MMQYEEFLEKFHITPNTQQADAIRCVKGHVLLLAVPGSGKTTTMVSRLGYMIFCENTSPPEPSEGMEQGCADNVQFFP